MFGTLTFEEWRRLNKERAAQAAALIEQALQDHLPPGYELAKEGRGLSGDTIIAVRCQRTPAPGQPSVISFFHGLYYRPVMGAPGDYIVTREAVRACALLPGRTLETDNRFGRQGWIESESKMFDLPSLVANVVAQASSHAPFVSFEWRACPHDPKGKWELFNGDRKMQSVWRSGSKFGTLMGTVPTSLAEAKQEAEAQARSVIATEVHERLSRENLGQPLEGDDDEPAEQESMSGMSL